jgi:hypothetical protein
MTAQSTLVKRFPSQFTLPVYFHRSFAFGNFIVSARGDGYSEVSGKGKANFRRRRRNAMETKFPDVPWIDPNFDENCRHIAQEELDKYAGRHVAYSWDGTRIVASGIDYDELARNVEEKPRRQRRVYKPKAR